MCARVQAVISGWPVENLFPPRLKPPPPRPPYHTCSPAHQLTEKLKYYLGTIEGLTKCKKLTALITGIIVTVASVVGIITSLLDPFSVIRHVWFAIFGPLMLISQLPQDKKLFGYTPWTAVAGSCGFLQTYKGRGLFFLFAGSTLPEEGEAVSYVAAFFSIFVGVAELIIGWYGTRRGLVVDPPLLPGGNGGGGGRAQVRPGSNGAHDEESASAAHDAGMPNWAKGAAVSAGAPVLSPKSSGGGEAALAAASRMKAAAGGFFEKHLPKAAPKGKDQEDTSSYPHTWVGAIAIRLVVAPSQLDLKCRDLTCSAVT